MRVSARSSRPIACLILALLAASPASADYKGLYLPQAPTGPGGEDSIETSGGTRCRQSINSNGPYLDVGVTGSASSPLPDTPTAAFVDDSRDREATAYARVTIPLGHKPRRLDCNQVYELEIAKLKREVELLKMAPE